MNVSKINFDQEVASKLLEMLKEKAASQMAKYPQYKEYFNDHLLVRANKKLTGRYGDICDAGEFLLAEPEIVEFLTEEGLRHQSICVWDMIEKSAKYVSYADVDFIQKKVKLSLRLDY